MYIIGLTGGIASGKSTVSKMLTELGAAVVDADKIARQVVAPQQPALQEIQRQFGAEVLLPDGSLNRKLLGEIVFADNHSRKLLENITHPYIKRELKHALAQAAVQGYVVAVLDVPLLIETGWHTMADAVWVVYVNRQTQLARLKERDKLRHEQAEARIKAQMSMEEKLTYADVVIDNNKDIDSTRRQVLKAWNEVKSKL